MKVNIKPFPKGDSKSGYCRVSVEIDDYDTWSLDHTLANIILPALIHLKETKQGVPSEFAQVGGEDYSDQESFDFYKESYPEAFDKKSKEWDDILDKMIWSFEQLALEDYSEQYHHGDAKYDWIKSDQKVFNPITGRNEDTYQMVDKNPDEHWYDAKGLELHEERIQEGLELFGKYYRSLWD